MLYRHIATAVALLFSAVFVFAVPVAGADATKRDQSASLDQFLASAAQTLTACKEEIHALSPDDMTTAKLFPILNSISSIANKVEDDIKASQEYSSTDKSYSSLYRDASERAKFVMRAMEFINKQKFDRSPWQANGEGSIDYTVDFLLDILAEIVARAGIQLETGTPVQC